MDAIDSGGDEKRGERDIEEARAEAKNSSTKAESMEDGREITGGEAGAEGGVGGGEEAYE